MRLQKRDVDGKILKNSSSLSKNMDDFIDNLNINNISREMQAHLKTREISRQMILVRTPLQIFLMQLSGGRTLVVLEGTHNGGPKVGNHGQ